MQIVNQHLFKGHQTAYLNTKLLLEDPEWKKIAFDETNTIGWLNFVDHSRFFVMEDHEDGSVFDFIDRIEYCKEICKRLPFRIRNPYILDPDLFRQIFTFSCDSIAFSMVLADWHTKHVYNPLVTKHIDLLFDKNLQLELEHRIKLEYAGLNFAFTTSRLTEIYPFLSPAKTIKANSLSIDKFKNALKNYNSNLNKELIKQPILDTIIEKPIGFLLSTLGKHDSDDELKIH